MSALKLVLGLWFLIFSLFLFISPVSAQVVFGPTCKNETKTWEQIDTELKAAEYGGPFDHSDTELNTYKDLYNRANNCSNTPTTSSGNTATGSGDIGTAPGQPLTSNEYNYLYHNQSQLIATLNSGVGMLSGVCLANAKYKCVGLFPGDSSQQPALRIIEPGSGGAIGYMGSLVGALYDNPPVSSTYYVAQAWEDSGLGAKTAYAQVGGSGQGIIAPILDLWRVSRNLAYLFFIVIFLVVGFMIMFRQRISQQTVVSAQLALPSLIIGLILVTFSYFIAALIVDLAFVGLQVVIALLAGSGVNNAFGSEAEVRRLAENSNALQLFWTAVNNSGIDSIRTGAANQIQTTLGAFGNVITGFIGLVVGFIVFGIPGALIAGLGATIAGPTIVPFILIVVLLVALFIQIFRLILALIMAYIQILFYTVAGPFLILFGSIPGRGGVVTIWWRGILANTLIFPAVFAAFLFAGVILGTGTTITTTLPLFGGLDGNFIRSLIAFGIILGTPAIPEMVRQGLGVRGPQAFGQQAIGGFMAGYGALTGGFGRGYGGLMRGTNLATRREAIRREQVARATPPAGNLSAWDRIISRLPNP